jgi:hypothetical protein
MWTVEAVRQKRVFALMPHARAPETQAYRVALAFVLSASRASAAPPTTTDTDFEVPPPSQYPHEVTPPAAPPLPAGFQPGEGFRIRSDDDSYLLRFAFQGSFKIEPEWTGGERQVSGSLGIVRPILRGNLYKPWFGYVVSFELAQEAARLLDANFVVEPWDEFGGRFGQQATPVSRHTAFSPPQIFFPDYASVPSYFWSGRQKGLTVSGTFMTGGVDYYAGVYGGSPQMSPVNVPFNYIAEGRVTINPMGATNANEFPFTPKGEPLPLKVSFTLQGYNGKYQTGIENFNPVNNLLTPMQTDEIQHTTTAGADIWFQGGPVIVLGEVYWRSTRPENISNYYSAWGVWGEAIVDLYRNLFGAGVRANVINPNTELGNDGAFELEEQVAWFIHPPELVLKARHAWVHQQIPDAAALARFPLFQLPFPEGNTQVATLQLNVSF